MTATRRLNSLDALRGFIMVLMAMDHSAHFIAQVHPFEFWSAPLPNYADAGWFLTRWLTHLCAPGFFFLMGAGMSLFAASRRDSGWPQARITRALVTRGLLLIPVFYFIEAPVFVAHSLSRGQPAPAGSGNFIVLLVLVTLGLSMAITALLLRLSVRSWLAIGFIAILAPNFLIPTLKGADPVNLLLRIFVVPGATPPVLAVYPLLPWLGICALGIAFGQLIRRNQDRALRAMLPMGLAYLIGYLGIRIGGGFGNLQLATGPGLIPFLTIVKYPPSLAFVLVTLGINFTLLSLFHRAGAWLDGVRRVLSVYGQAPLFFYLAHLYVYAILGMIFFRTEGAPRWLFLLTWLAGVVVLYPACLRYRRFKESWPPESLWRMF
jgi:uncharacterized membrane protein